jgi:tetrahydromethanopterin S-methyltransferase subunit B
MAAGADQMESRVVKLEQQVEGLSVSVNDMSNRLDKLSDTLSGLVTAIERNKPISYTSMLATIIGTGTVITMIVASISFFIDARVGYATQRSDQFVTELTSGGKIYVFMNNVNNRLAKLEGAIRWAPKVVSSD